MARHLNGVKYPKSQEELQVIVDRVEEKFARHIIVPTVAPVVMTLAALVESPVTVAQHSEECRCDACVHAYLEAMEKNREVDTEINYIG